MLVTRTGRRPNLRCAGEWEGSGGAPFVPVVQPTDCREGDNPGPRLEPVLDVVWARPSLTTDACGLGDSRRYTEQASAANVFR